MTVERGPIFICGLDRCGKTLLRALLVSHPHIAIPEIGSNYWTFFYKQYGDLRHPKNFERCLAVMQRYTHVTLLEPDFERIRRQFWQGEPTYPRLFALLNQQYAEKMGKPRWGDQSGLIEQYADYIFAAYPDAKMIHMLRDPRDRYEASLAHAPHGKGRVGGATARWLYSLRLARRNLKRYPDRYLIIQYETLVRQPEETLRSICAFLGEEFTPAMLNMEGAPTFREKVQRGAYGNRSGQLISTEFIGRFRQAIPPNEIKFMQLLAGKEMQAWGYTLEPIHLAPRQNIRFYLRDVPLNLARMFAWLGLQQLHVRFPAWFGIRPPADKLK